MITVFRSRRSRFQRHPESNIRDNSAMVSLHACYIFIATLNVSPVVVRPDMFLVVKPGSCQVYSVITGHELFFTPRRSRAVSAPVRTSSFGFCSNRCRDSIARASPSFPRAQAAWHAHHGSGQITGGIRKSTAFLSPICPRDRAAPRRS